MKWTSEYQTLEDARSNANKWTIRALITALVSVSIGYYVSPIRLPVMTSVADRLAFTLKWQTPSLGTLLFGILAVSNKRFHSRALDPIFGKDQDALVLPMRYLQNTVEQLLFSVISQLVLATYLESHQMRLIPVLGLLFVVGRFTFWAGYQQPEMSYTNRQFGHILTLAPSVAVFVYCFLRLIFDSL